MTDKCQWVESQLEAYVSESLATAERQKLEQHIADCDACRVELDGFAKVDVLVAEHFKRQLHRARNPVRASVASLRLAGAGATVAVALVAVWIGVGALTPDTVDLDEPVEQALVTASEATADDVEKAEDAPDAELAKAEPVLAPDSPALVDGGPIQPSAGPIEADARFYVQDAAGYFHTLEDFSGSVLILGVVDENAASTAAFANAYERYSSEVSLRFLGVSSNGADLDAARFPTMVNRRSALLETPPGEFAIVTPGGTVHSRGTLVEEELQTAIDSSLQQLLFKVPGDD